MPLSIGFVRQSRGIILKTSLVILAILAIFPAGGQSRIINKFSQGDAGYCYNPPTMVDNSIFIGTSRRSRSHPGKRNFFFKLDSDLKKIWEYPLGRREVRGAASLDSMGNIYFIVEKGRTIGDHSKSECFLFSLNPNGKLRWKKKIMSAAGVNNMGMFNLAISVDDTIYVGGEWKFFAFDANGVLKWTFVENPIRDIVNAPIIDNQGNIYFSAFEAVVSLTPEGNKRWITPTKGEAFSSPAFSTDYNHVYVGVGKAIYCFESNSGKKIWRYVPPGVAGTFKGTPAVDHKNNVYVGTKADKKSVLYAVKSDGSGLLWKNKIGDDLYSSPALGDDGTLYVGSEAGFQGRPDRDRLHAIDMGTGRLKWSLDLPSSVTWSSPVIADGGVLYIGIMALDLDRGIVFAVQTDARKLLPNAGSPRFHLGNESSGRRNDRPGKTKSNHSWMMLILE